MSGKSSRTGQRAVTVGMFDGVHLGHRHILDTLLAVAAESGLEPLVVTFDRHPRELFSPSAVVHRLTTNAERAALIRECGVERIVELPFTPRLASLSACEFLREVLVGQLEARVLVLGYDNMFGNKQRDDFGDLPREASRLGVDLRVDKAVLMGDEDVSSTRIRHALREGRVEEAAALLGAPYSLTGQVEQGFHIGRTLGFPTANVSLPTDGKLLPADGVYAVRAFGLPAMANLGTRPTFGSDARTLEVHLIDRQADLYGQPLTLQFVARLRDIRKYDSPEALAAQLQQDRIQALKVLAQ